MKKSVGFLIFFFSFFLFSCDREKNVTFEELPSEIQTYISNYFSETPVLQSTIEVDNFEKSYHLILSDATILEFNRKKEIRKLVSTAKLPDNVIPAKVLEYVQDKFSTQNIVKWELNKKNQEVELDNGLEIKFSLNGEFINLDD